MSAPEKSVGASSVVVQVCADHYGIVGLCSYKQTDEFLKHGVYLTTLFNKKKEASLPVEV